MHDAQQFALGAASGRVTSELVDAARRHLVMLRSLHEEVRMSVASIVPRGTGEWRSIAADRYEDRLDELRARLAVARDRLADAEFSLESRIYDLQQQLDAQTTMLTTER